MTTEPRSYRATRLIYQGTVAVLRVLAVSLVGLFMLARVLLVPALALVSLAAGIVCWTAKGLR